MAGRAVTWEGLAEFVAQVEGLPAKVTDEASAITLEAAKQAADDIRAIYPEHTGNLRRGVRVSRRTPGGYRAEAVVRSTAPHAMLYEYGTAERSFGAQDRGRMFVRNPAALTANRRDRRSLSGTPTVSSISGHVAMPVMGTRAAMSRRVMDERLRAMVARVTGAQVVDE